MSVHHVCMQYPQRPEQDTGSSGTGITNDCEVLCGCWKPKPGPLQEKTIPVSPLHEIKSSCLSKEDPFFENVTRCNTLPQLPLLLYLLMGTWVLLLGNVLDLHWLLAPSMCYSHQTLGFFSQNLYPWFPVESQLFLKQFF